MHRRDIGERPTPTLALPSALVHPTDSSRCHDWCVADWGATNYGDPCPECGFEWATTIDGGIALVSNLPDSISELVAGSTGKERHPQLAWSVGAYVCHIADNLRIWAERLVGVREGGVTDVHGYDENELARVRYYQGIPLGAAQWSLGRSVDDWCDAVARSPRSGGIMVHPERDELKLTDVVVSNAHDGLHHCWDIETILGRAER